MSIVQFIIKYAYAPVFFVGFIGGAVLFIEGDGNPVLLIVLLLLAIAASFAAERLAPFEKVWNQSKGDAGRDWVHAIVNELSNGFSIALIPLLAALTPGLGVWPVDWPLWLQVLMAILIADFGITMAHYASHKIEALWRLHAVHHSVERMYGFNGLMKHPLHQAIELTAGTTPLLLMGMPVEVGALLGFAAAIQLLLQHANVDMRVGPIIYLWAIAPGHRHHHIASKTKGNVNFGLFTMIWDHMLGTFVCNRPQPRDGELGIDGRPDFPTGYIDQIIEPFRKGRSL